MSQSTQFGTAVAASLFAAFTQAGPLGGNVASGNGSIATSGETTTITQSSGNLSLTWDSFNIGKNEIVKFIQPSASAVAVNRIYDNNGSQIMGRLNANGHVYLINPNGILFGQGAQIDVGSLIASTLDLKNTNLIGGNLSFSGEGVGRIVNQGRITTANGGYVALLGNTVINQGRIVAPLGTVALGAGSSATLTFQDNHMVGMRIDKSMLDALTENGGLIKADGGLVLMSAGARDSVLASMVNNTGVVEALTVENHMGNIVLMGGMAAGTVDLGGSLILPLQTGATADSSRHRPLMSRLPAIF